LLGEIVGSIPPHLSFFNLKLFHSFGHFQYSTKLPENEKAEASRFLNENSLVWREAKALFYSF
jgi:hypothetical protein